jgi:hypothetical protein
VKLCDCEDFSACSRRGPTPPAHADSWAGVDEDAFNALNLTGDKRDKMVVWDARHAWI